jgi:hypothetical protein
MTDKPQTETAPDAGLDDDTTSAKTEQVQAEAADNASKDAKAPATAHVADADADTEVAARSTDVDEVKTEVHRKEFVHGPGKYTVASGFSHEANIAAVRQYLINSGLRPVGEVEHVSTKTHEDGISKVLAYEVEAVPAHLAEAYEVAHAHVIQSDDGEAPATNPDKA